MNIWLINHYAVPSEYYPLSRTTDFAKYLMRKGHTVTVFSASTVHNSDKNLITDKTKWREETANGIHHVYIRCHRYSRNGLKRIYNICEFAWKLPGVCKKFPRPDAIVATSVPPTSCAIGIHLSKKYGCRGIAEILDLWPESIVVYGLAGPKNPAVAALRSLEKWIYKNAGAVVFAMEGAYDYILEQGWEQEIPKDKVFYINNGVDLEEFNYNKEHYRLDDPDLKDPGIFKAIYTGSVRKVNNLGLLVDAAKQITDPRVKILIWGDGDERPGLERRVASENITNVKFKGHVNKRYVPYITGCADLNIVHNMPSALFRFGISFNKIFDYMAAGKPMLSDFPCPYNPAVQSGAGACVEDPTPASVARAIEAFAAMGPEEYDGFCKKAVSAVGEYSFEHLTDKLIEVIERH